MTDTELITALGWTECAGDGQWCDTHGSNYSGQDHCAEMIDRLDHAEQGMALIVPILADLIAELRNEGLGHAERPHYELCVACEEVWPCVYAQHSDMADRAEARLKEATGNE